MERRLSDGDLLDHLMGEHENYLTAGPGFKPTFAKQRDGLKEQALARMMAWKPIPEGRDRSKIGNVLIAAMYPDGRTMSDVYHDWWTFSGWARWRHSFPPTHYMEIQPLPAVAESRRQTSTPPERDDA